MFSNHLSIKIYFSNAKFILLGLLTWLKYNAVVLVVSCLAVRRFYLLKISNQLCWTYNFTFTHTITVRNILSNYFSTSLHLPPELKPDKSILVVARGLFLYKFELIWRLSLCVSTELESKRLLVIFRKNVIRFRNTLFRIASGYRYICFYHSVILLQLFY